MEERRVQHIAGDVPGRGLCGEPLNQDMAGLFATCEECWRIMREQSKPS